MSLFVETARPDRRTEERHFRQRTCLVYFEREFLARRPGVCGCRAVMVNLSAVGVGLLVRDRLPPGACVDV